MAASGRVASSVITVVQLLVLVVGGSSQSVTVPQCLVNLVCLKLVGGVGRCVVQTLAHVVCCLCTLVVDETGHLWPTFSKQDGTQCVTPHRMLLEVPQVAQGQSRARTMWLT